LRALPVHVDIEVGVWTIVNKLVTISPARVSTIDMRCSLGHRIPAISLPSLDLLSILAALGLPAVLGMLVLLLVMLESH